VDIVTLGSMYAGYSALVKWDARASGSGRRCIRKHNLCGGGEAVLCGYFAPVAPGDHLSWLLSHIRECLILCSKMLFCHS
jgi:hypothetical protein